MLLKRITGIWINYLKSQLVLMVIIGVLTYIFGKLIGLPNIFLLSVIAGVGEGIPQIGPMIATIPAVIIAFTKGSTVLSIENWLFAVLVVALYWLIQQLENWLIKPKIVGDAVDIHPLISLIGTIAFGAIFGVPGMILAIPVIATVREIIRYYYEDGHKQIVSNLIENKDIVDLPDQNSGNDNSSNPPDSV
ncbi:MAG: AI-2E family transporter [Bacillota bacterium]